MIINPALGLEAAAQVRLGQMQEHRDIPLQWKALSARGRLLLQSVAQGEVGPYGAEFREQGARILGVESVKVSTVQSAIRKLQRKDLISKFGNSAFQINNPLLQTWLKENME